MFENFVRLSQPLDDGEKISGLTLIRALCAVSGTSREVRVGTPHEEKTYAIKEVRLTDDNKFVIVIDDHDLT